MFLTVFDISKVGIGPSSSHTLGPMAVAPRFQVEDIRALPRPAQIVVSLHGSLAFAGKGHGIDCAIALGVLGHDPPGVDIEQIYTLFDRLGTNRRLSGPASGVSFDSATGNLLDDGLLLLEQVNGLASRADGADPANADLLLGRR